jgi:hypothetical protein
MKAAISILLGLISLLATPAAAQDGTRTVFEGAIDRIPITLVIYVGDNVDPDAKIVSAHYFYDKYMIDIPLTVRQRDNAITLTGTDGSRFALEGMRYVSESGGPVEPAPTADHSDFLTGSWTLGSREVPVRLTLSFAGGDQDPDPASEAHARHFVHGVLTNNPREAADNVSYPLTINGRCGPQVGNKAAFLALWPQIATPALVKDLKGAVPHDMFGKNGMTMVGSGRVWFDDRGAAVLNVDCPARRRTARGRS